ncbi:RCC1 domain-containing protein RUG3, mitochondrial [Linum grandiflorum]
MSSPAVPIKGILEDRRLPSVTSGDEGQVKVDGYSLGAGIELGRERPQVTGKSHTREKIIEEKTIEKLKKSSVACCRRGEKKRRSIHEAPILYKSPELSNENENQGKTLQLLSWGRGSSGQLGGGTEETRLYPAAVANLHVLTSSFTFSPTPGKLLKSTLNNQNNLKQKTEIGISCGLFHSALLVDGKIWIWGKGDGGRLGLGHENVTFVPTLNPYLDDIRCIALGGVHSVALTSSGQIFTWGYGGFGALGHSVYHRELLPRLVEGILKEKMSSIATSGTHTAAVTETGELYTWGRDEGDGRLGLGPGRGPNEAGGLSIPSKVRGLPVPVSAVCCGGFFTMALTQDGKIWNWGGMVAARVMRRCKAALVKMSSSIVVTTTRLNTRRLSTSLLRKLEAGNVRKISRLKKKRTSITSYPSLPGMEWKKRGGRRKKTANSNYELGRGNKVGGWKPAPIPSLEDVCITQIACGGYHSLALTDEGKVLSWGFGGHGQLGHSSSMENQKIPVVIDALANQKVVYIACGGSTSAAITEEGKLYMWGNNRDFQLGVAGLPEVQPLPVEVKFLMEDDGLGPHKLLSVSVGASHVMCLALRSGC